METIRHFDLYSVTFCLYSAHLTRIFPSPFSTFLANKDKKLTEISFENCHFSSFFQVKNVHKLDWYMISRYPRFIDARNFVLCSMFDSYWHDIQQPCFPPLNGKLHETVRESRQNLAPPCTFCQLV